MTIALLESAEEMKVCGWTGYQTGTSARDSDMLPTALLSPACEGKQTGPSCS